MLCKVHTMQQLRRCNQYAVLWCLCVQVVREPVEQWQSVPTVEGGTLNLLDRFYSDPQKYAYTFQNYVFMSRVLQVSSARVNSANGVESVLYAANCLHGP
eukprot:GHRR01028546.1.p1 GENE.GHRR01028546.1~~GHRR01028546.1.p1  ORF type:complete len:100 (+),score=18.99 GHRR01028546.1:635-934(+)